MLGGRGVGESVGVRVGVEGCGGCLQRVFRE